MAEVTLEAIRGIVREEVEQVVQQVVQQAIQHEVKKVVRHEVHAIVQAGIGELRHEMNERFAAAERSTLSAINQVVEMVRALSDEDRDEFSGIRGRLHNHNERIARLERLNNLR